MYMYSMGCCGRLQIQICSAPLEQNIVYVLNCGKHFQCIKCMAIMFVKPGKPQTTHCLAQASLLCNTSKQLRTNDYDLLVGVAAVSDCTSLCAA
jgi:hypothetical protein